MSQEEIHILFPMQRSELKDGIVSFAINYMKCRTVAVMYYILHAYDYDDTEILVENAPFHIGMRWAVDETWSSYVDEVELSESDLKEVAKIQLELVLINVDDDNPIYFTELMLMNGEFEHYYEPDEAFVEAEIGFINNAYVNMYKNNVDRYLQIIRPTRTPFTTSTLSKSGYTILAPHLNGENPNDKPQNLFMEFINQTEQTTNIKPV